jgi:hypothetical protein
LRTLRSFFLCGLCGLKSAIVSEKTETKPKKCS